MGNLNSRTLCLVTCTVLARYWPVDDPGRGSRLLQAPAACSQLPPGPWPVRAAEMGHGPWTLIDIWDPIAKTAAAQLRRSRLPTFEWQDRGPKSVPDHVPWAKGGDIHVCLTVKLLVDGAASCTVDA